jgi:PAS domain S-box-containing protein
VLQGSHAALVEALPHLAWAADTRGRVAYVNGRYTAYVGRSPEDVVGAGVLDVPAEELPLWSRAFSAQVARREPFEHAVHLRRSDGVLRRHLARANPLFDERGLLVGYLGTLTEAEAPLLEERLRVLAAIVAGSADGIITFDLEGRLLSWNQAAERMYGWPASEVLGRTIFEVFIAPEMHELARTNLGRIAEVRHIEPFESKHLRRDGSPMTVVVSLSAIDGPEGGPATCSLITRDISAAKAAEAKIRASLDEKDVLLLEVHHRVKNNLQVVCSLLGLQATQVRDPAMLEILTDMEHRVRAIAMAHEKLYQAPDLARIDLAAHIRDVVASLVRTFAATPRRQRPALALELDETWVGVDTAIPCGLIVNELVTNALKYAFPEEPGTIGLGLRSVGERHVLVVADDGVGFPDGATPRQGSLGLRLVDTLVRQLGGVLERTTRPGTRVEIRFGVRRTRRTMELRQS